MSAHGLSPASCDDLLGQIKGVKERLIMRVIYERELPVPTYMSLALEALEGRAPATVATLTIVLAKL